MKRGTWLIVAMAAMLSVALSTSALATSPPSGVIMAVVQAPLPDPTQPGNLHLALAALLSSGLVWLVKKVVTVRDKVKSDILKAVLALVVSFGVAKLSKVVGLDLPGDPASWGAVAFNTLAVWLEAMGFHALIKKAVVPVATGALTA